MRTYGRIVNPDGSKTWVEVQTDSQGYNDYVWITTLIQCLKLNLGESPFYSNYGIPAHPTIVQQVFPDYYVSATQQQFSPYFANLAISRIPISTPTYRVNITTQQGVKVATEIAT